LTALTAPLVVQSTAVGTSTDDKSSVSKTDFYTALYPKNFYLYSAKLISANGLTPKK